MKTATTSKASEKVTTRWESFDSKLAGKGRRLVREYWQGRNVVRFDVVVTEYLRYPGRLPRKDQPP